MFLFAKVVMDNLAEQSSPSDLRTELRPEVFPHKLEEAYDTAEICYRGTRAKADVLLDIKEYLSASLTGLIRHVGFMAYSFYPGLCVPADL